MRLVRCPRCRRLGNTQHGNCPYCGQDRSGRSLRELSPREYHQAVLTDTIYVSHGLIGCGGGILVGIMAIVAGIVVAFSSGNWVLFGLTALSGMLLGYGALIGALYAYSEVDHRWLRLGRLERAWWAILLLVGVAAPLLVAALVRTDRGFALVVVATLVVGPFVMRYIDSFLPEDGPEPPVG